MILWQLFLYTQSIVDPLFDVTGFTSGDQNGIRKSAKGSLKHIVTDMEMPSPL